MNSKFTYDFNSSYSLREIPFTSFTSRPPFKAHEQPTHNKIEAARVPNVTPYLTPLRADVLPAQILSIAGVIKLTNAIE